MSEIRSDHVIRSDFWHMITWSVIMWSYSLLFAKATCFNNEIIHHWAVSLSCQRQGVPYIKNVNVAPSPCANKTDLAIFPIIDFDMWLVLILNACLQQGRQGVLHIKNVASKTANRYLLSCHWLKERWLQIITAFSMQPLITSSIINSEITHSNSKCMSHSQRIKGRLLLLLISNETYN